MPIYEFECLNCNETFDVLFRSPGERKKPKCPTCSKSRVRKKFSAFAMGGGNAGKRGGGCGSCTKSSCAGCHA